MSHYFKGKLSSSYLQFFLFSYTPSLLEEIFFSVKVGLGYSRSQGGTWGWLSWKTGNRWWRMGIARVNCSPLLFNVNKDKQAAPSPIWMAHALEKQWDERSMPD